MALTLSQFARLLLFLSDQEGLRAVWIKSKQRLTKKELDINLTTKYFWKTTFAPAYKDISINTDVIVTEYTKGEVLHLFDGIEKAAIELEEGIIKFKVSLNSVLNKYLASGQNNSQCHSVLLASGFDPGSDYTKKLFVAGLLLEIGVSKDHTERLSLMSRAWTVAGQSRCKPVWDHMIGNHQPQVEPEAGEGLVRVQCREIWGKSKLRFRERWTPRWRSQLDTWINWPPRLHVYMTMKTLKPMS